MNERFVQSLDFGIGWVFPAFIAGVGLVVLALSWKFKRRTWVGVAFIAAAVALLVLKPSQSYVSPIVFGAFLIGAILDALFAARAKRREEWFLVVAVSLLFVLLIWLSRSQPPNPLILSLSEDSMSASSYAGPVRLERRGLWATRLFYTSTERAEWVFRWGEAKPKQIRLWADDGFHDSKGLAMTGERVAERICEWAKVEAIRKTITDPSPGMERP